MTAVFSSVSEIIGIMVGGALYAEYGVKKSLSMSYGLAVGGAMMIILYGLAHQDSFIFPCFILVAKLGISSAFNILYVSHADIFPVLFSATALGFCNFVTRIFTGLSPIVAQLEEPIPMVLFFALCTIGTAAVWFIETEDGELIEAEMSERNSLLAGRIIRDKNYVPKLHEIRPDKLKKKHIQLAKKD